MYKTDSYTFRLWNATNFRGIQEHSSYKIYWDLFPIDDLRLAVETAK